MPIPKETTTDLAKLKAGQPYVWGKLIKIHDVGTRYSIVEFKPRPIHDAPNAPPEPELAFTAYVDGKETSGAISFDGALLICIGAANQESHEYRYMAMAAAKLLNVPAE